MENNFDQSIQIPYTYKPLSAWAYFGYSLLFAIPLVGFVLLIVFSFSNENINRRNFARSYWCALLVAVIVIVVLSVLGITLGYSAEFLQGFQDAMNGY